MTSLRPPRYLKLFDIQAMLRYIFRSEKRPAFIQFKRKPTSVVIALAGDLDKTNGAGENATLRNLGLTTVAHINEMFSTRIIYDGLLRDVCIDKIDMDCISEASLEFVEKHNIKRLFSYTMYVKTKEKLDESIFDSFIRPTIQTPYFLIAMDCEMVETVEGRRVGRVTLLDHKETVLYDKYIKPGCAVLDYLEEYSGLNEEKVEAGVEFKKMQSEVLEIIGTNTYVLGHGLENDLGALKLYTEKVIDTSYLFLNSEGYKVKLSILSKKFLKKGIQIETHCSFEDASCCLKLLAYKITQARILLDEAAREIKLFASISRATSTEEALRGCSGRSVVFLDAPIEEIAQLVDKPDMFMILIYNRGESGMIAW